jgi:hypothetical protein
MSLRDFLSNLGPMLKLKIPFDGWFRLRKPRVEIDAYDPPDQDVLDRMRKAEGKQDEVER